MADWISADSHNFTPGRQGSAIDRIIIHTVVGSKESAIATFQSPTRLASAHYIVGMDGSVVQMVSDQDTAWQAGSWATNIRSIGIEHADNGRPNDPRPDALYIGSSRLVAALCQTYNIPCDRSHILKHSEVSDAPTACPDALDIDRIVAMANANLHPNVGSPEVAPSQHFVHVVVDQGANLRTAPDARLTNVQATATKGSPLPVEAAVVGQAVDGANPMWWKIVGQDLYVYSGTTDEVPPAPANPQPQPADPPTPPATPDALPVAGKSLDQALAELDQANNDKAQLLQSLKDAQSTITALQKTNGQLTNDNQALQTELGNLTATRNANTALSDQVLVYQNKISELIKQSKDAYAAAFVGWNFLEQPVKAGLIPRLTLALKVFSLPTAKGYVLAYKSGMKLASSEAQV